VAAPRKRGPRLGGVLRAIGRLVLLIGFGFGVGLVVGLVWEEPALVYGHLRGEGETVPLVDSMSDSPSIIETPIALTNEPGAGPREESRAAQSRRVAPDAEAKTGRLAERKAPGPTAELPDVAAPPPASAPVPPPARPAARAASKPAASVGAEERWAIQVGAFSEEATARRLVKTLEAKSYPVAVLPSNGANQRWRVRVQPLRGEEHARGIANQLKREEGLPTWLIPMEAGSR
jgi:cell division septation protein DedD